MPIVEPIIRPPAEANSFLLQVTLGCSANHCSFCGAYTRKTFAIKPESEIFGDIERQQKKNPSVRKVFLLDGDALAIKNSMLVPVLQRIQKGFPQLSRISSYANGFNLTGRSGEELKELYDNKLRLLYLGLESGSQKVLSRCGKRSTVREMVEAVKKAAENKIKSSVIVLLGLGGKELADEHVKGTIEALNEMQPRYLSFLSLMFIPGTPLYEEAAKGEFERLAAVELLQQAHDIVEGLELKKTIFRTDHASNYISLDGRFPKDKKALLSALQAGINGDTSLRAEWTRGL